MTEMTFEEAHKRLEEILHKMNSEENIALDESLSLFEEANQLIVRCQGQLSNAQQRIDLLIKEREGQIATEENGTVQTRAFSLPAEQ